MNYRPIIMAYENFENGDIGFKFLDNENFADLEKRLDQMPWIFKRSEFENAIKITDFRTLYLRNKRFEKDYELMFRSAVHVNAFLKLFPEKESDESKTKDYYFMS